MGVPCVFHNKSLGSLRNCSVIIVSILAPLLSLARTISRTCRNVQLHESYREKNVCSKVQKCYEKLQQHNGTTTAANMYIVHCLSDFLKHSDLESKITSVKNTISVYFHFLFTIRGRHNGKCEERKTYFSEHEIELLVGIVVAALSEVLPHLLLHLLSIQVPAVLLLCTASRCGVRGTYVDKRY